MLGQLPTLNPGEIERWLLSAAAVAGFVLLVMKLFPRRDAEYVRREEFRHFRMAVEQDLGGLRDRIDSRHLGVIESIEKLQNSLQTEAERRDASLHRRLGQVESIVARLDERTKRLS
ncbi:MAG TPA: hypothetical protein VN673_14585 [Clostridia bacterium]|nr:hypothetical protein [Clostridia bacterium]